MKTFALTIAATMFATSSAFAGGLFDVNDAPAQFELNQQVLDTEATAAIGTGAPVAVSGNYKPLSNAGLFDVEDLTSQKAGVLDLEATASIGSGAPVAVSGNYNPFNNTSLFDVNDRY